MLAPATAPPPASKKSIGVLAVCLVLLVIGTGFAANGWGMALSFSNVPNPTTGAGISIVRAVGVAFAAVGITAGVSGRSWLVAWVIIVHAVLTFISPFFWLFSVVPTLLTVAIVIVVKATRRGSGSSPWADAK